MALPSLSSIALFLWVLFTSLAQIGHSVVSAFVAGVIGLVYCVLWFLAAFGVYDGNVARRTPSA